MSFDVIPVAIGAAVAFAGMKITAYVQGRKLTQTSRDEARLILDKAHIEAKSIERDAELKAKEERINLQRELDRQFKERQSELKKLEQQALQKESRLERKLEDVEQREKELNRVRTDLDKSRSELSRQTEECRRELEKVSQLSADEARELLLKRVDEDFRYDVEQRMKHVVEAVKEDARDKVVNLLAQTVQKVAVDYKSEALITVVPIPNEETKGRIIGREGRNIRAFEQVTGIDVIIDDTPDVVVLSGFNAIKRVVATRTLEQLISDGRIHPARIEEVYADVQKEMDQECLKAGEDAAQRAGVHRLGKPLLMELGRLKFRTSYGQNVLDHSVECAQIAGILAAEIGANAKLAKRAALLHDIGKVIDGDDTSHARLGAEVAKKCGEKPVVVNAIMAHHEEVPMESPLAFLVAAADSISASRRGARFGQTENYVERLENLEKIAKSFDGVQQAFAIQAGREVRVLVNPEKVDDSMGIKLSHEIVQRIEEDLEYPGQIKVVVVRENRYVDYAF